MQMLKAKRFLWNPDCKNSLSYRKNAIIMKKMQRCASFNLKSISVSEMANEFASDIKISLISE